MQTGAIMEATGARFAEAHLEARAMARLAAAGHEVLGYDTVMPVFSVTQAAALGCQVDWGHPLMMPGVRTHPFAEMQELRIPEFGYRHLPSRWCWRR
jgi:uroporphyrinogen-III decarboxylase